MQLYVSIQIHLNTRINTAGTVIMFESLSFRDNEKIIRHEIIWY